MERNLKNIIIYNNIYKTELLLLYTKNYNFSMYTSVKKIIVSVV